MPKPSVDIHFMDQSRQAEHSVSIGLTDTAFVPQDLKRVALIIGAPPTNRVTLSHIAAAVLDSGITLYPGGPPLVLSLLHHGAIVKGPIRAITTVGAQTMTYWSASTDME